MYFIFEYCCNLKIVFIELYLWDIENKIERKKSQSHVVLVKPETSKIN